MDDVLDLSATTRQLVNAYIWVVLGMIVGIFFLLVAVMTGATNPGSIAIGLVVTILALISGYLEYRALPGAILYFGSDELTIHPRRGSEICIPYDQVTSLTLAPGQDIKESARRFDQVDTRGSYQRRQVGVRRGIRRPYWYLSVQTGREAKRAGVDDQRYAVGADLALMSRCQQLCQARGIPFSAEE